MTLVTGQGADLPLAELAAKARAFGFDGVELAAWGDHFEVSQALSAPGDCERKRVLLKSYNLEVFAIGAHIAGPAVLDLIDLRHRALVSPQIWGDGGRTGRDSGNFLFCASQRSRPPRSKTVPALTRR